MKGVGEWRAFHLLPYIRIEFKPIVLEWQRLEYLLKFIVSGVIFKNSKSNIIKIEFNFSACMFVA